MNANPHADYRTEIWNRTAVFFITREHKANALTRATLLALGQFARETAHRSDIRALLITGQGEKYFCAGADLEERLAFSDDDVREQIQLYRSEFGAIDNCPKVVVAAINGLTLGGGLELAMACDLRVAHANATFGQPECSLGIIPGAGGTQRLPRLVGPSIAKEMILLGRRLTSTEAHNWGLINRVVRDGNLLEDAMKWLQPVLDGPPGAHEAALQAIDAAELPLAQGLEAEASAYDRILSSEDRLEGLRAFIEKRPPRYVGR